MGFDTKQSSILEALKSVYTKIDEGRGSDYEAAREEVLDAQRCINEAIDHLELATDYAPELEGVARGYIIAHLESWSGSDGRQTGQIGDLLERLDEYSNPPELDYDEEDDGDAVGRMMGRNESTLDISKLRSILGLKYIKESKHSLETFNIGDQIEFSANGRIVSDATVYDVDDTFAYAVSGHIHGMRGRAHFFEIPIEPHDYSDSDAFAGYDAEEDADSNFGQYDFQQDKIFIELKSPSDINIFLVNVSPTKQQKVADVLDGVAGSGI